MVKHGRLRSGKGHGSVSGEGRIARAGDQPFSPWRNGAIVSRAPPLLFLGLPCEIFVHHLWRSVRLLLGHQLVLNSVATRSHGTLTLALVLFAVLVFVLAVLVVLIIVVKGRAQARRRGRCARAPARRRLGGQFDVGTVSPIVRQRLSLKGEGGGG
jgi:hypothetical protein